MRGFVEDAQSGSPGFTGCWRRSRLTTSYVPGSRSSLSFYSSDVNCKKPLFILRVPYYVYILASKRNGTLYIGMTGDLAERMMQHKQKYVKGFTQRYHIYNLVYAQEFERVEDAQANEYRMKRWRRAWKLKLIESINPN